MNYENIVSAIIEQTDVDWSTCLSTIKSREGSLAYNSFDDCIDNCEFQQWPDGILFHLNWN